MSRPKKLYKYQSFNEYSIKNLTNQQIFFCSPLHFNDPFDCAIDFNINYHNGFILNYLLDYLDNIESEEKDNWVSLDVSDSTIKNKPLKELIVETDSNVLDNPVVNHFKEAINNGSTDILKDILRKEYFSELGVVSLSKKNNDILMWSHYAKGHRGFCLEFDTQYEPFNRSKRVRYSKNIPDVDIKDWKDGNLTGNVLSPILTKYETWQYEKEYRIIHEEADYLEEYDSKALTGIYFGSEMDSSLEHILIAIAQQRYPHVNFYKSKRLENQFKVEFDHINQTKVPPEIDSK